jgi:hypothetical protein
MQRRADGIGIPGSADKIEPQNQALTYLMPRYLFKAKSPRDDFVVDAEDERQAVKRAEAVARYQNVMLGDPMSPRELLEDEPVTANYFKDGYFIVNSARLNIE